MLNIQDQKCDEFQLRDSDPNINQINKADRH